VWRCRTDAVPAQVEPLPATLSAPVAALLPPPPAMVAPPAPAVAAPGVEWSSLEHQARACQACGLHRSRSCVVFGQGQRNAAWMLVADAPDAEDDRQGQPFAGRAGRLLDAMLAAIGVAREQVYLTHLVKCHPPAGRTPLVHEIRCCRDFLTQQIALVRPRLVVALGIEAAQALAAQDVPAPSIADCTLYSSVAAETRLATLHSPHQLMAQPLDKARAWQALQWLQRQIAPLS